MRQAALAIVDDQTDIPKPLASEKWETEIVEKPRSWGDVAQNALCPCGFLDSNRRNVMSAEK